jgi:hypothetical protein
MGGFGVHPIPSNILPQKYTSIMESFYLDKKCGDGRGYLWIIWFKT